jgi:hypothetical protein
MGSLVDNARRRTSFAAFGAGFLGLPDWTNGWLLGAVPAVREALDAPRCLLEHRGLVAPSRARFKPSAGGTTGGARCAPSGGPRLDGAQLDDSLVVVSGLGGVVQRVARDGAEMWRTRATQPRGAMVAGPYVLVGSRNNILWLNKKNGLVVAQTGFDWPVNGVWLRGSVLAVAFRTQGAGAVRVYELHGFAARETFRLPSQLNYPRGVYLSEDSLYVAGTFGHKVLRYERRDGGYARLAGSAASFYPNSIRTSGGRLLVAEEHINQIAQLDPGSMTRHGAAAGCWNNGQTGTLDQLLARVNEHTSDGESVCRASSPTGHGLLAPNDAVQSSTALYVADTDNSRIVMYKGGVPVAVLSNFNEPVNVDIVT